LLDAFPLKKSADANQLWSVPKAPKTSIFITSALDGDVIDVRGVLVTGANLWVQPKKVALGALWTFEPGPAKFAGYFFIRRGPTQYVIQIPLAKSGVLLLEMAPKNDNYEHQLWTLINETQIVRNPVTR
jgi:hypothetical protein